MVETWKQRVKKGLKKAEWKVLPTRHLVEGTPLDSAEFKKEREEAAKSK